MGPRCRAPDTLPAPAARQRAVCALPRCRRLPAGAPVRRPPPAIATWDRRQLDPEYPQRSRSTARHPTQQVRPRQVSGRGHRDLCESQGDTPIQPPARRYVDCRRRSPAVPRVTSKSRGYHVESSVTHRIVGHARGGGLGWAAAHSCADDDRSDASRAVVERIEAALDALKPSGDRQLHNSSARGKQGSS